MIGAERVCTGGARPFAELLDQPFVVLQVAAQIYHDLHVPAYGTGLLGRNCAVERTLLERSCGLDAKAATGTDYVLAKALLRAGARIRQIPEARVATSYPTSMPAYIRQQDRWLRNIVLQGLRFGAFDEVRSSLMTSIIGICMLVMPVAVVVLGPNLLVIWLSMVTYALLSRLRYLRVAGIVLKRPVEVRHLAIEIPMLFLDFFAWGRSLCSYLSSRRRELW
jgi:hypothetical protein